MFNWDNRPLDDIGIPGRINRFQIGYANGVQSGLDDTHAIRIRRISWRIWG